MSEKYSIRIQIDNRFRFWCSIFIFTVCALYSAEKAPQNLLYTVLLFLLYTLSYGIGHLLANHKAANAFVNYFLIAIDTVFVTGAIFLTGNLHSPFFFLYLVVIGLTMTHRSITSFVYATTLSLLHYGGLLTVRKSIDQTTLGMIVGQLVLLTGLIGILYGVLITLLTQQEKNRKVVSRSKCLASVADVLSGSLSNSKDWIKSVSAMIEDEFHREQIQCQITLYKGSQPFLPPSGGDGGIHFPIMVGDHIFGALQIGLSRPGTLSPIDQEFFKSVGRSLGQALHRAKLWKDFQSQLEKIEASLLLNSFFFEDVSKTSLSSHPEHRILGNMIELVKTERGRWKLKKEYCQFGEILKDEIERAKDLTISKNLNYKITGSIDKIPVFLADSQKLRQVLANLLFHSAKTSPKGADIKIQITHDEKELNVAIQDQGEGIAPDRLEDIFDPFRSAGASRSGKQEARDLGLSICRKVIEAHKGRIWAESPGLSFGATITFTIPLERMPKEQSV